MHLDPRYRKELSKNLNIKEDEEHIFRAYGRLNNSELNSFAKNPVVLAPKTELCRLVILEAHGPYHNSTAQTIAEVRRRCRRTIDIPPLPGASQTIQRRRRR
ncbi:unnamed protein product [Nippostrongylus brasiliensis]|uniref:Uncharacterized protein n=1 Tax=Nippostrongylus brasiliensis TaxID=27835 RepID=A0A0N4Y8F6_NIPBR|nr:unnamed protein product [Nippostrongylus brasiliensis]